MTAAFEITLKRYRARVEHALARALPRGRRDDPPLYDAMRYATLGGGKRVRASLVYAAGAALGAPPAQLDSAACALELIHAYSLVHDDLPCMDDDDLRRGKPTCHKAFDEATALLAGDALQALAFELIAGDRRLRDAARVRMLQTLTRAAGARGMAGGQAVDLAAVGGNLTLAQLRAMHARKTGALIEAAVLLGAYAAGARSGKTLRALTRYARAIGLAFQITDDILDVEGETALLGKRRGADAARNKPTYPALMGLAQAKSAARAAHRRALASLALLRDNGRLLAQLADYIVTRDH